MTGVQTCALPILDELPPVAVSVFKELGFNLNSVHREELTLALQSSATSGIPSTVVIDKITAKRQGKAMVKERHRACLSAALSFCISAALRLCRPTSVPLSLIHILKDGATHGTNMTWNLTLCRETREIPQVVFLYRCQQTVNKRLILRCNLGT